MGRYLVIALVRVDDEWVPKGKTAIDEVKDRALNMTWGAVSSTTVLRVEPLDEEDA